MITKLIETEVTALADMSLFRSVETKETKDKGNILKIAEKYDSVVGFLNGE